MFVLVFLCVHACETGFRPEPMSSRIAVLSVDLALRKSSTFVASVPKTRRRLKR
jgi:hypothetical protein